MNTPTLRLLACSFALFVIASSTVSAQTASQAVLTELDQLVADNDGHGGGIVRIADRTGVLCQGVAGKFAGPGSPDMTPDRPFEIASITKAVTAATILVLAEEGKLTLDTPIGKLLPAKTVQGFDGSLTIRQLLSHTSGLLHYWTDGARDREGNNAFLRSFLADPGHNWTPDEILSYAREIPSRRPGRFHYSDTNFVLLGLLIEHVTGQPLHTVYREKIFRPLGMDSTWLTYHESRRGAPQSHRYEGSEDLTDVPRQSADWAGGGLVSTARDLERFLRGLADGKLFRNPETLQAMLTFVPTGEQDISYGLGLYRVKLDGGLGEVWGHDGHGNSFAYYWPQRGVTFTGTLNQVDNDWWPLVEAWVSGGKSLSDFEEDRQTFNASLSTGWDSLYMDKGANGLNDSNRYGSGIYWTALSLTWNISESNFLTAGVWQAFATSGPSYRETDADLTFTQLVGDGFVSLAYDFNYGYSDGNFYSNELVASVGWDFTLGPLTLTPSATYWFALGPDSDSGSGFVEACSSFLNLRLDGNLPLYRDILALDFWGAFGVNFRYNTSPAPDDDVTPFTGPNNLECGLSLPIRVNRYITFAVYGAYSYALTDISGTAPSTFWGGGSVQFSY
ncbi:MAG: beta-lactamase family protein [Verrucomicrobia bacterium]|nr:beta-lactamase family protein [Verrucomicrobiota bacterium]